MNRTQQQFADSMSKSSQQRVSNDTLQALELKLSDVAKTMRENKTILAYEMIRTLQEFVAYERAKHSTQ
jgi:hypothetical protein